MPTSRVLEELPDGTTLCKICYQKRVRLQGITMTLAPLQLKYQHGHLSKAIEKLATPYFGQRFWVYIVFDSNKNVLSFNIEPTVSAQIQPDVVPYIHSLARRVRRAHDGSVPLEKVVQVAQQQRHTLSGGTLSDCVLTVIGTCKANGVKISRMHPTMIEEQISSGELQILENGEILRMRTPI
jgi:ribosomal protein L11